MGCKSVILTAGWLIYIIIHIFWNNAILVELPMPVWITVLKKILIPNLEETSMTRYVSCQKELLQLSGRTTSC